MTCTCEHTDEMHNSGTGLCYACRDTHSTREARIQWDQQCEAGQLTPGKPRCCSMFVRQPFQGQTFSVGYAHNRTHAISSQDDFGGVIAVCGRKFEKDVLLDGPGALVRVDCWNCRKKLGLS